MRIEAAKVGAMAVTNVLCRETGISMPQLLEDRRMPWRRYPMEMID